MKKLIDLVKNIDVVDIYGDLDTEVENIQYDSRKCKNSSLFVAIKGNVSDGHKYIEPCYANGVRAFVCEYMPSDLSKYSHAVFIKVKNARKSLALLSHNWYDQPSEFMKIIGVTGTNGKTTITYIIKNLLESIGLKIGVIGTTGILIGEDIYPATHTTPESLELCAHLDKMRSEKVSHVIMEVSSHALHQDRVDGVLFDAAIFTNLTHEHLDYHSSLAEYAGAKKILFEMLPEDAIAIINGDTEFSEFMIDDIKVSKKLKIGRDPNNDIVIMNELLGIKSTEYVLDMKNVDDFNQQLIPLRTQLMGRFNIDNTAMAATLAYVMGMEKLKIQQAMSFAKGAPGRMQRIDLRNGAVAIVDYAHTPDALEKALIACRNVLDTSGGSDRKLICVFGCGGDRDNTKRPLMGKYASKLADSIVICNDNPRTEDPEQIIFEILNGVDKKKRTEVKLIPDRALAIEEAVKLSKSHDLILVAGKGHEDYQIIGEERLHFDDTEQLQKFI
jgi:UDP-N-acetylmuramoyl-L-alanyl-D-glutamate--2,6-diaminopimelate ligase